jgi:hypothetical protein
MINSYDLLGLTRNPATHGTKKCESEDCCEVLLEKTKQWIRHYNERHDEARKDWHNYKVKNPIKYNNHIVQVEISANHVYKCIEMMLKKCRDKIPDSEIPLFIEKPKLEKVPIDAPIIQWDTNQSSIQWEYLTPVIGFGILTLLFGICPFEGSVGETVSGAITLKYLDLLLRAPTP